MTTTILRILLHIGAILVAWFATAAFVYFVYAHVLVELSDWTFGYFQKYLVVRLQPIDQLLMQWSCVLWSIPILFYLRNFPRQLILTTAVGISSLLLSLSAGIAWSLFTWNPDPTSPLLPEYVLHQPFDYYWTVFVLIGIALPIGWVVATQRKQQNEGSTLDDPKRDGKEEEVPEK